MISLTYIIIIMIIYIIIDIIIYIIILPFKFQFCNHIFRYLGFADQWHTGGKHLSKFRRETRYGIPSLWYKCWDYYLEILAIF